VEIAKGLIETLKSLCVHFSQAKIKFCLIGGLAVGILSKPRATEDIDLLVLIEETEKQQIRDILLNNFRVIKTLDVMHFKKASIWRILLEDVYTHKEGFIILDLLFADNAVYKETVLHPFVVTVDGIAIPLASPENLIKIKELSNRPQDLIDIEELKAEMNTLFK